MALIYLDIETDGLDVFDNNIVTIQMLLPSGKVVILQDPKSLDAIRPILERNVIIGHNLKFDLKFIKHKFNVNVKSVYDTYLAELVISGGLFVGKKDVSRLKDLIKRYCNVKIDKTEQTRFKLGMELTKTQLEYAARDLLYLPEIYRKQQEIIKKLNLESVIDTEMKALPAIVWLELSGIYVDQSKLDAIMMKVEEKKYAAETELYRLFGTKEINLNSSKQLKEALNKLGIPVESTSTEELARHNHIAVRTLKDYREAEKLLGTFIDRLPEHINEHTKRVHANFMQIGTNTGRMSCRDPNLQQQPSKTMPEYRSIFRAEPGNKIITTDYSQIELRIIAQVSQDPDFINAYVKKIDMHTLTASKVFNIPFDSVDKKQRNTAKPINFGISYGMSGFGLQKKLLVEGIKVTDKEAKRMVKEFYKGYPGVTKYLAKISSSGLKHREVRNLAGRLIKFNKPKNQKERNRIKRESKNKPIQSLCGDMIKIAMGNIFLQLEPKGVKFINCIHDELVFECAESQAEEVKNIIKSEMEKAGSLFLTDVPCIADPKMSDVWEKD